MRVANSIACWAGCCFYFISINSLNRTRYCTEIAVNQPLIPLQHYQYNCTKQKPLSTKYTRCFLTTCVSAAIQSAQGISECHIANTRKWSCVWFCHSTFPNKPNSSSEYSHLDHSRFCVLHCAPTNPALSGEALPLHHLLQLSYFKSKVSTVPLSVYNFQLKREIASYHAPIRLEKMVRLVDSPSRGNILPTTGRRALWQREFLIFRWLSVGPVVFSLRRWCCWWRWDWCWSGSQIADPAFSLRRAAAMMCVFDDHVLDIAFVNI
jgi:hypothetical protein